MLKDLLFIVNPRAGRTKSRAPLYDAISIFCNAGYRVFLQQTQGPKDATRIACELGPKFDLIVCSGGDGTLNETINGMMEIPLQKRPPLSYLPSGSTNDFASGLSISSDPATAAQSAMRLLPRHLDIGIFNDRHFVYVASFGAFTRTSYSVPQDIKNTFGHFAYLLEGVKDLDTLRPYHMRIETDDEVFDGQFLFGAVCNSTSVAGLMKISPEKVSFDDGQFELMLIPVPKTAAALQKLIHVLIAQDFDHSDGLIFRHISRVTAQTTEEIPWTLDGEYAPGASKVDISIAREGIQLMI